jgi:hypothetical protein
MLVELVETPAPGLDKLDQHEGRSTTMRVLDQQTTDQ